MIPIDEALERCLQHVRSPVPERVRLGDALDRVLLEDVHSTTDLPPWDNSAMDGYAVRAADFDTTETDDSVDTCATAGDSEVEVRGPSFDVVEVIAAGSHPVEAVGPGQTSRIMTGAPMPEGADAVIMREVAVETDGTVRFGHSPAAGAHIRRRGEDVSEGDLLVEAGTILHPGHLSLCAAAGVPEVIVARQPSVAILGTGDELVEPGTPLGPGQIYGSNNIAIAALARRAGVRPVDCGVARDNLDSTREALQRALACDFIVTTGGVSVGDFDVVKEAFADVGVEMDFWKVRMKPGKPLAFGAIGDTPVFGLPGNPVSCMVNFLQFVRPVLRRSMGDARPYLPVVSATLSGRDIRKKAGREELVRVRLQHTGTGLVATPSGGQGSHMLASMAQADGFALIGRDSLHIPVGSQVSVQVFESNYALATSPGYQWTDSSSAEA